MQEHEVARQAGQMRHNRFDTGASAHEFGELSPQVVSDLLLEYLALSQPTQREVLNSVQLDPPPTTTTGVRHVPSMSIGLSSCLSATTVAAMPTLLK